MITVFRKEIKYIIPRRAALSLEEELGKVMQRDSHGDNGNYFIRSQYYDSAYDRDLWDNLDGMYEKRKIRLRIYDLHTNSVKLEYKCKNGQDGVKFSMDISKEEALGMERGDVSFLLDYDNELALRLWVRMTEGFYRPKAIVDYRRLAFTYPAGDVRITFDREIRGTICPYGLFDEVGTDLVSGQEQVLMEVKYTGFLPDAIRWLLRDVDELATSNSKYSSVRMLGR